MKKNFNEENSQLPRPAPCPLRMAQRWLLGKMSQGLGCAWLVWGGKGLWGEVQVLTFRRSPRRHLDWCVSFPARGPSADQSPAWPSPRAGGWRRAPGRGQQSQTPAPSMSRLWPSGLSSPTGPWDGRWAGEVGRGGGREKDRIPFLSTCGLWAQKPGPSYRAWALSPVTRRDEDT